MQKHKTKTIFLFTPSGGLLFPHDFPAEGAPLGALEGGIGFDERVEASFYAPLRERLFTACDPGGGEAFSALLLREGEPPPFWRVLPLRALIHGFAYSRPLRMYHLAQWRDESRYCGSCGAANADAGGGEYARVCPRCGRKEFPRISPAVLVLIKNERGQALLAHNVNFRHNVYSLIAGFMEAGENLERAVEREVREEVGLTVRGITFVTSQSWPFPNSLMAGFEARYHSGGIRCDKREIADARWFSRGNLPELPAKGSVSRFIIDKWLCEGD
jgi:NAD+ diphosphatase